MYRILARFLIGIILISHNQSLLAQEQEQASEEDESQEPNWNLSTEDREKASPLTDDVAKWALNLRYFPSYDYKGEVVGREKRFALSDHFIFTPFKNRIIQHSLSTGDFPLVCEPHEHLISQYIDGPNDSAAITFFRDKGGPPVGDILYIRRNPKPFSYLLKAHTTSPWRVLFSPDGKRLVSCADDQSMRLWDLEALKEIAKISCCPLRGNNNLTRGEFAAFSPDGRRLATAYRSTVTVRRPTDGGVMLAFDLDQLSSQVKAIRFSPDSQILAVFFISKQSQENATRIAVWDFAQGKLRPFVGKNNVVIGKFMHSCSRLVTWNGSRNISIWDAQIGAEIDVIEAHGSVRDITFSPADNVIAVASGNEVEFWNTRNWKRRRVEHPFSHVQVDYLRFNGDGEYLVTCNENGLLKIWKAPKFANIEHVQDKSELKDRYDPY